MVAPRLLSTPNWRGLRYVGELAAGDEPFWHDDSLVRHDEVLALGRYFKSGHHRDKEPLTRSILQGKTTSRPQPIIERGLLAAKVFLDSLGIDLVTSVPPNRHGIDRFAEYRELIAESIGATAATPCLVLREIATLQGMQWKVREDANAGRFGVLPNCVEGARVLLVDDVIASGSTLRACRDALAGAGAAGVVRLAFGSTQG